VEGGGARRIDHKGGFAVCVIKGERQWRMEEREVSPLPKQRTIGEIEKNTCPIE